MGVFTKANGVTGPLRFTGGRSRLQEVSAPSIKKEKTSSQYQYYKLVFYDFVFAALLNVPHTDVPVDVPVSNLSKKILIPLCVTVTFVLVLCCARVQK